MICCRVQATVRFLLHIRLRKEFGRVVRFRKHERQGAVYTICYKYKV